jgi:hypothetical protein
MKTLLLTLLLALPAYTQSVEYDKFKDLSFVSSESVRVGAVTMTAKAMHKGEKPEKVDYYLTFRSSSRSWRFLYDRDLTFLVDGTRLQLGKGDRNSNILSGRVTETLIYTISRGDLEKLVGAASVEMQLGLVEAKLDDKDKKGLREILGYKMTLSEFKELPLKLKMASLTYLWAMILAARYGEPAWIVYFARCVALMGAGAVTAKLVVEEYEKRLANH